MSDEARRTALALIVACMDGDPEAIRSLVGTADAILLANVAMTLANLYASAVNQGDETDPEFSHEAVRARIVAELRASP